MAEVSKSIYIFIKYAGYLSYKSGDDGRILKTNRRHLIISTIVQVIGSCLSLFVGLELVKDNKKNLNSIIEDTFILLFNLIQSVLPVVSLVTFKVYNRKILKCINKLQEIEIKLNGIEINLKYVKVKVISAMVLSTYPLLTIIATVIVSIDRRRGNAADVNSTSRRQVRRGIRIVRLYPPRAYES